jgi:hypothetical protein
LVFELLLGVFILEMGQGNATLPEGREESRFCDYLSSAKVRALDMKVRIISSFDNRGRMLNAFVPDAPCTFNCSIPWRAIDFPCTPEEARDSGNHDSDVVGDFTK